MKKNKYVILVFLMSFIQLGILCSSCEPRKKSEPSGNVSNVQSLTSDELNQISDSVAKQVVWDAYWHPTFNMNKFLKVGTQLNVFLSTGLPNHPEMLRAYVDETQSVYDLYRDTFFVTWSDEYQGRSMPDGHYEDEKRMASEFKKILTSIKADTLKVTKSTWTKEKVEMVGRFLDKGEFHDSDQSNLRIVVACPNMNYPRIYYYVPENQHQGEIMFNPNTKLVLFDQSMSIGEPRVINKAGRDLIARIEKNGKWFKLKNHTFVLEVVEKGGK